jgi:hypothetical protein
MFAIAKTIHNTLELNCRTALQTRLNSFLQAFGKNFGAPREINAESTLFSAHLRARHHERNETDADNQACDQAQAQLHKSAFDFLDALGWKNVATSKSSAVQMIFSVRSIPQVKSSGYTWSNNGAKRAGAK